MLVAVVMMCGSSVSIVQIVPAAYNCAVAGVSIVQPVPVAHKAKPGIPTVHGADALNKKILPM